MKLAFSIAKRFLMSAKRHTIVIVFCIAIGVSIQVFIGLLLTGLGNSLIDSTIGSSSQITITYEDNLANYNSTVLAVSEASDNISVVTETLTISGALTNDTLTENIVFRGFNFDTANQIYKFDYLIVEGQLPTSNNQVALGIELKEMLDINVGDTIVYNSTVFGEEVLEITGFFDFNVLAINQSWVITPLTTVQDIIGEGDQIGKIEMQLDEVDDDLETKAAIVAALDDDTLDIVTWSEQNGDLLSSISSQQSSSILIQVCVIISVILSIVSVLSITVLQKSRQLSILKAMGIQDKDASFIFLFEGFLLGIFGAMLGVVFGVGLTYAFTTFAVGSDGSPIIPLTLDYGFIALSAGIALTASTLAALSPAIKSSKLSVIEVIRNG
ncbi:MAG: ABC transporter permease [Tenericutes bacterium]|nr:ABC transporter permease [Mycoplasmatota bacterium]